MGSWRPWSRKSRKKTLTAETQTELHLKRLREVAVETRTALIDSLCKRPGKRQRNYDEHEDVQRDCLEAVRRYQHIRDSFNMSSDALELTHRVEALFKYLVTEQYLIGSRRIPLYIQASHPRLKDNWCWVNWDTSLSLVYADYACRVGCDVTALQLETCRGYLARHTDSIISVLLAGKSPEHWECFSRNGNPYVALLATLVDINSMDYLIAADSLP